jgi:uncharacterized protein YbjT (DUF2867 family)
MTDMRITVVAATGGIGRHVLCQALAQGHEVNAVVRNPGKLVAQPTRVFAVDLSDPDEPALKEAMTGADAVLSALGSASRAEVGIAADGTRAIVQAMQTASVRRVVAISAAPVGTVASPRRPHPPRRDPGDGFVMGRLAVPVTRAVLRGHYADLAVMEDILGESGLDWTVLRPPRLTNRPGTGRYRVAHGQNPPRGWSIPRADVADCMLKVLDRPESVGQVIGLAT